MLSKYLIIHNDSQGHSVERVSLNAVLLAAQVRQKGALLLESKPVQGLGTTWTRVA